MQETDWKEFRKNGLGSSDAPVINGDSPYSTPYKLWQVKTGRSTGFGGNFATRRGHELEPKARANYELMSEREMPATLAVHPQFPWMRASLDGWNAAERVVLEIKCPGKVDHELALEGKVPEKYYPQLQHQIFVANAERADYYSFDGERGICIQVKLNGEWFKDYFLKAMAFWEMVQTDTPPELVLRDWTSIRSKQLRLDLEAWHSASLVNDEHAEYLLNQMIAVHELENRRIRCSGFLVNGISRSITIGFPQQMQQQSPAVHQTI